MATAHKESRIRYPDVGRLGRINRGTTTAEIQDGLSQTIMTGELQRLTNVTAIQADGGPDPANQHPMSGGGPHPWPTDSHDGWAVGGDATLFSTGIVVRQGRISTNPPMLMNNNHWGSPGSLHAGNGANFGFADGSVKFLQNSIDASTFALLGSMADGVPGVIVP